LFYFCIRFQKIKKNEVLKLKFITKQINNTLYTNTEFLFAIEKLNKKHLQINNKI